MWREYALEKSQEFVVEVSALLLGMHDTIMYVYNRKFGSISKQLWSVGSVCVVRAEAGARKRACIFNLYTRRVCTRIRI